MKKGVQPSKILGKKKVVKLILIMAVNCSHFLAATFDFTTFSLLKATPFFHSLAVFVWSVSTPLLIFVYYMTSWFLPLQQIDVSKPHWVLRVVMASSVSISSIT